MKMTRNNVKELAGSKEIYCCGYCKLQAVLIGADKLGSNSGAYGWNYNIYRLPDGSILTTGYRGAFGKRLEGCEEIEKRYTEAKKSSWDFDSNKKVAIELLEELLQANR